MSKWPLTVAGAVLAVLLLVQPMARAQEPADQTQRSPIRITSRLTLGHDEFDYIEATSTTTIEIPTTHPALERLIEHAPETRSHTRALLVLVKRMGIHKRSKPQLKLEGRPVIRIRDGRAMVTLKAIWFHTHFPDHVVDDAHRGLPNWTTISTNGRDVRFMAYGPVRPGVRWHVSVESDCGDLVVFSPTPAASTVRTASWTFTSTRGARPVVRVDLRPDEDAANAMRDNDIDETMRAVSAAIAPAAVSIVLLMFVAVGAPRVRRLAAAGDTQLDADERRALPVMRRAAQRAARLATIATAASLAALLSWLALPPVSVALSPSSPAMQRVSFALLTLCQLLPAVLVYITLLNSERVPRARRRGPAGWLSRLDKPSRQLLGVLVACIGLMMFQPHPPGVVDFVAVDSGAAARGLVAAAGVFSVAFCLAVVLALPVGAWAALPTNAARQRMGRYTRPIMFGAGIVGGIACVRWQLLDPPSGYVVVGDEQIRNSPSEIYRWLPVNLLRQTAGAFAIIVLIALIGVLEALGRTARGPLLPFTRWTLAGWSLVFAGSVVGVNGQFGDVSFPLPLLVSLVLLPLICVSRGVGLYETAIGPRTSLTRALRADLLETAAANDIERRRLRELETAYLTGRLSRDEYTAKKAVATRSTLDRFPHLSANEVGRLAFAVGPDLTWWSNALVSLRIGALLMIPPVIYYVVVLVMDVVTLDGRGTPATLGLLVGLASEIATWLGGALTMGALYLYLPGRIGAVKGLSLAVVYLVASSCAVLFGETPAVGWAFRLAIMIAFFVTLGVLVDRQTLLRNGFSTRRLTTLYRLRNVRVSASFALPVLLIVLTVIQQLLSGAAQEGIRQLIETAPLLMPPGR